MADIQLTPALKAVLEGAIESVKDREDAGFSWKSDAAPYHIQPEDLLAFLLLRLGIPESIGGITLGLAAQDAIEDAADRIINESMP